MTPDDTPGEVQPLAAEATAGHVTLTPRQVAMILLWIETGMPQDAALQRIYQSTATATITPERVRQIRSKLLSRLRGAAAAGPLGPAVREEYANLHDARFDYRTTLRALNTWKGRP